MNLVFRCNVKILIDVAQQATFSYKDKVYMLGAIWLGMGGVVSELFPC